jgi:CRP-like cAMP-binding protein
MLVNGEQLQNYSLFGGLGTEVINTLVSLIRKVEFDAGELIFAAGSDGDEVCFILEGEVSIVTDGLEVARLSEGEQFGEMHLIDIMPRSADVFGVRPGSFLALHHRDMFRLRKIDSNAYVFLLMNCSRDISRRLRIMNRKYVELLKLK